MTCAKGRVWHYYSGTTSILLYKAFGLYSSRRFDTMCTVLAAGLGLRLLEILPKFPKRNTPPANLTLISTTVDRSVTVGWLEKCFLVKFRQDQNKSPLAITVLILPVGIPGQIT